MFQFTTTNVINSNVDTLSGLTKIQGTDGLLRVLRVADFKKDNICNVFKRAQTDPVVGKAVITLTAPSDSTLCRVKLYVRLSGSQNSYYSNDFVFKGKPFVFEFAPSADATAVAKLINKIKTLYGDKFLKVTGTGAALTFEGDEYTLFTEAKLQKYVEPTDAYKEGTWSDVSEGTITASKEGFGTYTHILKDLRLPTIENLRFTSPNEEEMPIPGAKYNQYTIEYQVNDRKLGGDAVGQVVSSKTTHVFYVKSDIVSAFETAVTTAGATITTEDKPKAATTNP